MKHQNLLWGAAMAALLTGCIDDNYDLSDIDTTSEFKVKDLVLPLNLLPVELSDIIHVKEGEKLKEVTINGNTFYAVEQEGDITADDMYIDPFTASPEPMYSKTASFTENTSVNSLRRKAGSNVTFRLSSPVNQTLEYKASDIDGSIRSLDIIYNEPNTILITIKNSNLAASTIYFEDMVFTYPKGMIVNSINAGGESFPTSVYNPSTGALTLNSVAMRNGKADIEVTITGIDISDASFAYDESSNSGSLDLVSDLNLESCQLKINDDAAIANPTFDIEYGVEPLAVESIIGDIVYDFEGSGLNIEPIDLEDLPSFLSDKQTNLILSNPQIYLKLENPLGKYGLGYQSGLAIEAVRENSNESFPGPEVKVPGKAGEYNYVLAPNPVSDIAEDYAAGISYLPYERLGYILSGNGLPELLDINLVKPQVPQQKVTSPFELDRNIEGMEGNYMFLAPLALADGSTIVKRVDGWYSDDLADLNIEYFTLMFEATNGLPCGVNLRVYAINEDGKQISTEGGLMLPEDAAGQPVEVTLKGLDGKPFNHLDGVELYVIAADGDGEPLAPSQVITIDNLKGKITGYYLRKL